MDLRAISLRWIDKSAMLSDCLTKKEQERLQDLDD